MRKFYLLGSFILLSFLFHAILIASQPGLAKTPNITWYNVTSYQPNIHNGVEITWQYNDSVTVVGTLITDLFWSRDNNLYYSVEGESIASYTYQAHVPAQDGSEDLRFTDGVGRLSFYIRLYLEGQFADAEYLFSESNPNTEVYFVSSSSETTSSVTQTPPPPKQNDLPLFNQQTIDDLGEVLDDFFHNPVLIYMVIAALVIGGWMLQNPKKSSSSSKPKKPKKSIFKRFFLFFFILGMVFTPSTPCVAADNILIFSFNSTAEGFQSNLCQQTIIDGSLALSEIQEYAATSYDGISINAALISQIIIQIKSDKPSNFFSISFNDREVLSREKEILMTESLVVFNISVSGIVENFEMNWNSLNSWENDTIFVNSIVFKGSQEITDQNDQIVYKTVYNTNLLEYKDGTLHIALNDGFLFLVFLVIVIVVVFVLYKDRQSGGKKW